MFQFIPVAWIQLTYNRSRFLVALAGIAFATLLMFMQLGFQAALYKTAIDIQQHFAADIILIDPRAENLYDVGFHRTFTKRYLVQSLAVEGVDSVAPLYIAFGHWKNPKAPRNRQVLMFGFDPDRPTFDLPEVNQNLASIKRTDIVLFDRLSKPIYGPIVTEFEQGKTVTTEINGHHIKIGGLFNLGGSVFSADGIVITSDLNFVRLTHKFLEKVSVGLIKLKPTADRQQVLKHLEALLPKGVKVLTLAAYMNIEKDYWRQGSPIGSIFTLGTIVGFIVGAVIVYQILYSEVSDHIAEYATLKAIGYTNTYLLQLIFQESLFLSILGYIPGFAFSMLLYDLIARIIHLPTEMEFVRALFVLFLTILMCFIAGIFAIGKLRQADPADIF
jgi:putative ABC transport system permease protein